MTKEAVIIDNYRYFLLRQWDENLPKCLFIMLNPSTADASEDDPTIRRVKSMAKSWGFGWVYMLNLFTYISTDPKKLNMSTGNHRDADHYLRDVAYVSATIVAAWGNFKVMGRDTEIKKMLSDMRALKINKNGSPKHPLYCPTQTQLVDFNTPF